MGSDVTVAALKWGLDDRVKPLSKILLAMQAAGQDAKDLDVETVPGRKQKESANKRGQDTFIFVSYTLHST